MIRLLSIALTSIILTRCGGFPSGLEADFCGICERRPMHGLHMPQNTLPPYKIDVTSTVYRPNETINITLRGLNPSIKFKGFFFSAATSTQVFDGSIQNRTSGIKGVGNCGMSHTDNTPKSSITISWTPPPKIHVGAVQFRAVVVASVSTFWEGLSSDKIMPDFNFAKGGYKTFKQIQQEMNPQPRQNPLEGNSGNQTKSLLTRAIEAAKANPDSTNKKAVK